MDKETPLVSIIMGIYNCAATLTESIESILNQTYKNWEFIICDDGSTDSSYYIAKSFSKKHNNIIVIRNGKNEGLAYTLNKCLQIAKGDYIARQDGDDRSISTRLEKEVDILDRYPQFDIVSCGMALFDENGQWGKVVNVKTPDNKDFIFYTPFCHGPAMIRKSALLRVGGYKNTHMLKRVEDYDLWFRLYANGARGYNIQDILYEARDDRDAINRRKYKFRLNEAYVRFKGYKLLNLPLYSYLYTLRPLIVGLIPEKIYKRLRNERYKFS